MTNAMWPRFGGPMGRHAARRGVWFNPLPWVLLAGTFLFLVLFLRHTPCVQVVDGDAVNAYIRACYSDIQTTFLSKGFGRGEVPVATGQMLFPPLTAALVFATQVVGELAFDAPVAAGASVQDQVNASVAFFGVTAVVLYVCFVVTLLCLLRIGRGATAGRGSWDAMIVAASPVVLAVGLINWDFFPLCLTALGVLLFSRRAVLEAGIVLGLAACAGTMPIAVILAIVVACGLRGGWRVTLRFAVPTVVTFFVVHLPLMILDFDAVYGHYHGQINKDAGYGSLWYLASLLGAGTRETGSLAFVLLILFLAIFISWLYVKKKRPRVGTLIAVIVFVTALLGPAYPPQTALWLLFALYVARPLKAEVIAFTVTQVAYCMAVWAWLNGSLTTRYSGPYAVYWLAIACRAVVEVWIVVECLRDITHPRRDPLRTPTRPDLIGGVLVDGEELARVA